MDLYNIDLSNVLMPEVLEQTLLGSHRDKDKEKNDNLKKMLSLKTDSQEEFFARVSKYIYKNQKYMPSFLYLGLSYKAYWVKYYLGIFGNKTDPIVAKKTLLRLLTYTSPLDRKFYLKDLNKNQFYKYLKYNLEITYKIFQGYIALIETKNKHERITKDFEIESYSNNLTNFITADKTQQNELYKIFQQWGFTKNLNNNFSVEVIRSTTVTKPLLQVEYNQFNNDNINLAFLYHRLVKPSDYYYTLLNLFSTTNKLDPWDEFAQLRDFKTTLFLPIV